MDPFTYSPYELPSFGSYFLPFRFWQAHVDWVKPHTLAAWEMSPFVVGVA